MPYDYKTERPKLFNEEGQTTFLKVRDRVKELIAQAGAARTDKIHAGISCCDSWFLMACVDRLV